jgi:NADP-dependent 3-hydroxy acid dehydrogenase YdfG
MKKTALVTGATSGIGKATAEKLAEMGYNLIITGRRENRLNELKKQLIDKHATGVYALSFDIQDFKAAEKAISSLPQSFQTIDVLVNNAGLAAGLDLFQEGNLNDWEQMIDTNIKGLLYISRLIAPKMTARKSGHIINISSIAGTQSYGKGGVYCATKHAVEALTRNMRIDMLQYGIRVSSVSPGAVETEFSEVRLKDKEKAKEVYKGFKPLSAEDIAETVGFVVSRPAHVNINDILIMPTAQADAFHTHRKE